MLVLKVSVSEFSTAYASQYSQLLMDSQWLFIIIIIAIVNIIMFYWKQTHCCFLSIHPNSNWLRYCLEKLHRGERGESWENPEYSAGHPTNPGSDIDSVTDQPCDFQQVSGC